MEREEERGDGAGEIGPCLASSFLSFYPIQMQGIGPPTFKTGLLSLVVLPGNVTDIPKGTLLSFKVFSVQSSPQSRFTVTPKTVSYLSKNRLCKGFKIANVFTIFFCTRQKVVSQAKPRGVPNGQLTV